MVFNNTSIYQLIIDFEETKPMSKTDFKMHILEKFHIIEHDFPKTVQGIDEGRESFNDFFKARFNWIRKKFFPNSYPKYSKKKTAKKPIAYLITLESCTDSKIEDYKKAYNRILKYKKFKITDAFGVIEFTKKGLPHLHMYVETDPKTRTYISTDLLKRIWSKSRVKKDFAFDRKGVENYLSKDPARIVM